jgi:HTH-type transcriptional regulator/antitoxin HigA
MVTKTAAYPDVAIPPGEYLAEEIEARGISQKELAKRMGRPINAINEIINGKKSITAETALQLEEAMPEIPARFWLNLETDYQLTRILMSKHSKLKSGSKQMTQPISR